MSLNDIFENMKLTVVECPSDVKLPRLEFVSEMLSKQLKILGMSPPEPKVTKDFVPRPRVPTDPPYSLENLRESEGDILGLYCHNSNQPEIILYVDSCVRASKVNR
jgi:hypothetical protein